jgi:hypothetical protein
MKYSVGDQAILVDGQPVARIETLSGEFDGAKIADLISAANRGIGRQQPASPPPAIHGLVNDIDETGAPPAPTWRRPTTGRHGTAGTHVREHVPSVASQLPTAWFGAYLGTRLARCASQRVTAHCP